MIASLHHFRIFLSVAKQGSITQAAIDNHITQSAVTQAMKKLSKQTGTALFHRGVNGLILTNSGRIMLERAARAFEILDPYLSDIAPRLKRTVTFSQLKALIAVNDYKNYSIAAHRLGLAQPTVHKAISQLEAVANKTLFTKSTKEILAIRSVQLLAHKARLALIEFEQAEVEIAHLIGNEIGVIIVGAMPLSRSHILPRAISNFKQNHPKIKLRIIEGSYSSLLEGLQKGEIDILIGALRSPSPDDRVIQEELFEDQLAFVARHDHPLVKSGDVTIDDLSRSPWIVALPETPTRTQFDKFFLNANQPQPRSIVESASIILMRELLRITDHLGCISRRQVLPEVQSGILSYLPFDLLDTTRIIGLTYRANWMPTSAQIEFLSHLRESATMGDIK